MRNAVTPTVQKGINSEMLMLVLLGDISSNNGIQEFIKNNYFRRRRNAT